jgi:FKBP-type peptidyl-prolyl cis-trans isomerase FklB
MKMKLVAAVVGLMVSTAWAADTTAPVLKTTEDKISYSIGSDLGKHLKRQEITINQVFFVKGIEDAMAGGPLLMTEAEMKDVLNEFQKTMMAKRVADMDKQAIANKAAGDAFLKANQTKSGVVTLPSGLQYKIVTAGKGEKPTSKDTVTVEYTGRLINGTVFDSTEKTGKPATFNVSQVIPGWTEALQLMPAGSTWELYIPANLAYGTRNVGGSIGPNETLIFNVHLMEVKKEAKAAIKPAIPTAVAAKK